MEIERSTGIPQSSCWCTRTDFPPALLESIAPEARGKACICQACAQAANSAAPTTQEN
ncbi:MAG TPA: cysteine-rich CWC family protein [Polaromonas sp.]|nr:cysteine-rich CWC family protein [Polaromonas sp.]